MLVKRIAAMYPSIFNRFPVIQPVSSKVRYFSTFFAHFGLPIGDSGPLSQRSAIANVRGTHAEP